MNKVRFGDVVSEVKLNVDRSCNPYAHYVAGDHMDSEDLTIHRYGNFATDDVGPAFTRIFKPGQILYGSRRTYLKKVAVASFEGICANTTFVLESKDESVFDNRLLPFVILSDKFTQWSISHSKGSTNPYVLFSDLTSFEFTLPPIEEQRVLADKLWAAYKLKESYKNLLVATDEMVKSQFIEMFGTGTPKHKISDVCEVKGGSTPSRTNTLFWDNGDVPWFTIEDIYTQGKYIRETKQHITKLATKKCFVYPKNTVVICCTASIGECALAKIEMASNQQFNGMIIKDRSKLDPQFLLYVSSTLKDDLLRQAGKTTIHFVSRTKLEEILIPVPTMDKQQRFVRILEQADKSKFELRKSIEAIDALIKSLING